MLQDKSKLAIFMASATAMAVASISTAQAALPPAVETAFTTLAADGLDLIDLAWTVAVPLTIGFIILGMFKRAARSAT